jgi:Tfp pilus assembly protein PilN
MIVTSYSVGIEIGGQDLRVAVMRSSFGKVSLLAVHRISGFLTLDEEERKKAIRTLVKRARIPATRVYLLVARDQGILRQVDLPTDVGQRLPEIVKLQVETLSPWPLDEIYWDFASQPARKNQKFAKVTIAIIPRTALDPWIAFFKSVGLPLSGATLSSLAYGHAANSLWKEATPTIILHREESCLEAVLVNGTHVAALTAPSSQAAGVPQELLDRLLSVAKLPSAEGSRVLMCGGDPDPAVAEENPRLPIENAKPESTNDFGSIAAALLPLKDSAFKANLVPAEMRYRQSQMQLIPACILGFLTICAGALLMAREPYQTMAYASRVDSEIRKIAPQVREVAAQEAELTQLTERYRALTAHLGSVDHNLEALRELARVLPPSAFLTNYVYQDGTITVSGFGQSASEIQSLLENSPVFKSVEFTTSVTRDATGKDRFTLKMAVEAPK